MTVEVRCNLSKLPLSFGVWDDVSPLRDVAALTNPNANGVIAQLDTVFYQKRLWTLSGPQYGTTYVHNIILSSGEYIDMLNKFKEGFKNSVKNDVFDNRMMIGGGMMDKVRSAVDWLKPRVKSAVDVASKVADVAAPFHPFASTASNVLKGVSGALGSGHAESVPNAVVGGMMDMDNTVSGGRSRGRRVAAPQTSWRNLL